VEQNEPRERRPSSKAVESGIRKKRKITSRGLMLPTQLAEVTVEAFLIE
jgi:hypothetical protein